MDVVDEKQALEPPVMSESHDFWCHEVPNAEQDRTGQDRKKKNLAVFRPWRCLWWFN